MQTNLVEAVVCSQVFKECFVPSQQALMEIIIHAQIFLLRFIYTHRCVNLKDLWVCQSPKNVPAQMCAHQYLLLKNLSEGMCMNSQINISSSFLVLLRKKIRNKIHWAVKQIQLKMPVLALCA